MSKEELVLDQGRAVLKDVELYYRSIGKGGGKGSGEAPLILFLHGFPEFWAEWEQQLKAFGGKYHAVAPDLRGFNLSSKPLPPEAYHIKLLVEDICGLVEHLGHRKMVLVAHDWGGGVAWAFANRHPDMVEKLVIINSPHPAIFARELLNNPDQQSASEYMNLFRSAEAEKVLSHDNFKYLQEAFTGGQSGWIPDDAMLKRYISAWSQPDALTGGLNYYRISPLHPPTSDEESAVIKQVAEAPREMFTVKVPTLVIWGEMDAALLPGNLDGLDRYVDHLRVERIPDGSHWVVHEQPDRINRLIRSFIEDQN